MLLLSRNDAYEYLNKLVVAEITATIRAIPVEVRLGRREGMPLPYVANLDNLRTVAHRWLDSRAGALAPSREGSETRFRIRARLGRTDRARLAQHCSLTKLVARAVKPNAAYFLGGAMLWGER